MDLEAISKLYRTSSGRSMSCVAFIVVFKDLFLALAERIDSENAFMDVYIELGHEIEANDANEVSSRSRMRRNPLYSNNDSTK